MKRIRRRRSKRRSARRTASTSSDTRRSAPLGTTPRRLTDLVGSLCDLTSGSGDKGTPVIYIQGYFDNYLDD
ncbi:MAG: coenzyme F420-0:L-glutamate ligase [Synergistaceae bacterium]|nr:coenzyme F420-0:L-glutamate ligase [Synergistaceae bacterium]